MKSDNLILTQYIDEISKKKKIMAYNIAKLKKDNKEIHDRELQEIKIKYKNLEKFVEDAMKENEKYENEKKKLNELIQENENLKNESSIQKKNKEDIKHTLDEKIEREILLKKKKTNKNKK